MSNIVLTSENITSLKNSELTYKFPRSVTFDEGNQIAVSNMMLYYSWFNISAANQNNFFQYTWWDENGDLTQVVDVFIPDGYYSVQTLNEFFISVMTQNGHYLIVEQDTSRFVYFLELLSNSTYYSTEIRLSSLSGLKNMSIASHTPAPGNDLFLTPTGWSLPQKDYYEMPQLLIPANNKFGELIGFNAGTVQPSTPISTEENVQVSILNDKVPQMEPQSSFVITCNLVKNPYSNPSNVLGAFSSTNVSFGGIVSESENAIYSNIAPGTYDQVTIKIFDQNFVALNILDSTMLFVLHIK